MKCYDCDLTDGDSKLVVGVCRRCGLLVCADHARVSQVVVHRPNGMGKTAGDLPARRLLCDPCHQAERAR